MLEKFAVGKNLERLSNFQIFSKTPRNWKEEWGVHIGIGSDNCT